MRRHPTPFVRIRPNWRLLAQPRLWILGLAMLGASIAAVRLDSLIVYLASLAGAAAIATTPWTLRAFRNAGAHWREERWTDASGREVRQLSLAESITVPEPQLFGRIRSRRRLARLCVRDRPEGTEVFVETSGHGPPERNAPRTAERTARAMPVRYDGDGPFVTELWTEDLAPGTWRAPQPVRIIETLRRSARLRIAIPERHPFDRTIVFRGNDAGAQRRLDRFMARTHPRTGARNKTESG